MPTFDDLMEEVVHNLTGFSTRTDAMATTIAPVSVSDLAVRMDSVDNFAVGVVEIDTELVFVNKVDTQTSTIFIPAWGRGYRGTEPADHGPGSRVTMAPTWARATVGRALNQAIRGLWPTLFGVKSTSVTIARDQLTYALPAEAVRVLDVRFQDPIHPKVWSRVIKYDVLFGQGSLITNTGVALEIYDALRPGTQVSVSYAVAPQALTAPTQDWSYTGLGDSSYELAVLGATFRLLPSLDAVRLPTDASSAVEADAQNQIGTAATLAKTYAALYADRLQTEAASLNARYPARYRRVR